MVTVMVIPQVQEKTPPTTNREWGLEWRRRESNPRPAVFQYPRLRV